VLVAGASHARLAGARREERCDSLWRPAAEAFAEQGEHRRLIERRFASLLRYEKINYLMLMMVDPTPFSRHPALFGDAQLERDRVSRHGMAESSPAWRRRIALS
jgi:hypothetical protein